MTNPTGNAYLDEGPPEQSPEGKEEGMGHEGCEGGHGQGITEDNRDRAARVEAAQGERGDEGRSATEGEEVVEIPTTTPPVDFRDSLVAPLGTVNTGDPHRGETTDPDSAPHTSPPPFLQEAQGRVKGRMKSRMVVVENVYHQVPGEEPQSITSRYTRWLNDDEQTYTRKTKANLSWAPLDFGWILQSAQVVIVNTAPTHPEMVLTDEQYAELEFLRIEIGVQPFQQSAEGPRTMWSGPTTPLVVQFAVIYPGESLRFEPCQDTRYMIRGNGESVPYTLNVIPN